MSDTNTVKNWSYPFKTAGEPGKEVTDPQVYFDALAKAANGFYPIGKNGLWHGGVHFDNNTAALLDQSSVRCIADGEVIAYRIDQTYPETQYSAYTPGSGPEAISAKYSTGFVLVKHRLALPPAPSAPATGTTPVEPECLTFYSLYMHLLDWAGYGKPGAPTPPSFLGETLYSVKPAKATDPILGLRVRAEPISTATVRALLPKGTRVRLGDTGGSTHHWRKLVAILEGQALPTLTLDEHCWVFPGELQSTANPDEFVVGEQANDAEPSLAPGKGFNVRKTGNGHADDPKTGLIPVGTTFTLEPGSGDRRKLKAFVSGQDISPLAANSAHNIQGFVYVPHLQTSLSAPELDKVVVLEQPLAIKAGELIGHPGIYQNHDDRAATPLIHLEVFCCEDLPSFIGKSRAAAPNLPAEQKTLLKVHKGASKLITHRADINVSNPPKVSDAGVMVGVDLILSQGQLDSLPADRKISVSETVPGSRTPKVTRWWRLDGLFADADGNPIGGWLAEQPEITTRHSPWEWEGFGFISETACNADHLACHLDASATLEAAERTDYAASIDLADNGPLKSRLYDIIDGADGSTRDNKLTPREIRTALSKPWHAQSIARLAAHYESEWFWSAEKWDALDTLMAPDGEANADWAEEKKRIKKICWLNDVLASDGKIWHIHFHALLSNMLSKPAATLKGGKITFDAEGNDISGSIYFSRSIHWPGNNLSGVTLGRGYDMGSRSESEIYNHMISAGIPPEQSTKISAANGLKGTHARDFVTANKEAIGTISREQQIALFNLIYPDYVNRAIANYDHWTTGEPTRIIWDNLDQVIRDILVDFVYQGFTKGPNPMKAGMTNNSETLIQYIENTPSISQYEAGRHRTDYIRANR